MKYAMSNLNGNFEHYRKLLDTIHFAPNDEIYMLGNIIGNQAEGIRILFDMMKRKNIIPFFGAQEYDFYRILFYGRHELSEHGSKPSEINRNSTLSHPACVPIYSRYYSLPISEQDAIWDYLSSFLFFGTAETKKGCFFLSHEIVSGNFQAENENTFFICAGQSSDIPINSNQIIVGSKNAPGCICLDSLKKFYLA